VKLDTYAFNQDIGSWNVSNVTDMSRMFYNAHTFNQDIDSWNVSKVSTMSYMFYNAHAFNQDISSWDISSLTNAAGMFKGTAMTVDNMDNTLRGWAKLDSVVWFLWQLCEVCQRHACPLSFCCHQKRRH
jgi:surface protein